MGRRARNIGVFIEDDGSFARFLATAPKVLRAELKDAVRESMQGVEQRMRAKAPVGPDAPHIKDDIESSRVTNGKQSISGRVGFITTATKPAVAGGKATQGEVALYNEYRPNSQAFMRPAAEDSANEFLGNVKDAIKRMDNVLSRSVGSRVGSGGVGGGGLI